jgi:hypothetical protein
MRTFEQILDEAAETGRAHVRALAMAGIVGPVRLYYKTGALMLQSDYATCANLAESDGWIKTERTISAALPYDRYWQWLRNNSGDLPIFAEACVACVRGDLPSHSGSPKCESGSIASGGHISHCTCDTCF